MSEHDDNRVDDDRHDREPETEEAAARDDEGPSPWAKASSGDADEI